MSSIPTSSLATPATPLPGRLPRPMLLAWLPTLAAVGFLWLLVLNQQRLEWTVNPVYSYGWAVPFLAGCLAWLRWSDRPALRRPLPATVFWAGIALLWMAYLPVRIVQEANPDWVKINWSMAGLWMGVALLTLARVGGWRYAVHFLFPIAFTFTALPWPVWFEDSLSQALMRMNASVSAETLTLLGTPALAQGNLVQVADRWVNVEEACSGIRSLQTAFMMSLFLGEFYRMGLIRRASLLLASFGAAFVVNLVRTVVLTHFAKTDSVDRWHDTVGTVAMVVCLIALWLLAEAMQRGRRKSEVRTKTVTAPTDALVPPFGWRTAAIAAVWLVAAEGLTRGWYLAHERALPPPIAWELRWPRDASGFVEGTFPERTAAILKFNAGATAGWRSMQGDRWQMYFLEWEPGRVSKFLSSAHYPTVCLPATGMKLVSETGVWSCRVNDVEIPFSTYMFDEGGRDVYVFHAVIEDRPAASGGRLEYRQVSSSERIESVVRGERNLGQRVVGIALRGPLSPSEARAAVTTMLGDVLHVASAPTPARTASLP